MSRVLASLVAGALLIGACASASDEGVTPPDSVGSTSEPAVSTSIVAVEEGSGDGETGATDASPTPGDAGGTWTAYPAGAVDEAILVDADGFIWAFGEGGAVRVDPSDLSYVTYSAADGLASTYALDGFAHPDGSVWVETLAGLSVWRSGSFGPPSWDEAATPWSGRLATLRAIDATGRFWVATDAQVFVGDGERWQTVEVDVPLDPMSGFAVDADGWLWMASLAGLVGTDGLEIDTFSAPRADWAVWDIAADPQAGIWIAGSDPAYFDGESIEYHPGAHGRSIAVAPDGAVWMVSDMAYRLDDGAWTAIDVGGWSEAVAVDEDGDVWLTHQGEPSLVRISDGVVTRIRISELEGRHSRGARLAADGSGRVYVENESIVAFTGDGWEAFPDRTPEGFPTYGSIVQGDPVDGLWMASQAVGIVRSGGTAWDVVVEPSRMPEGTLSAFGVFADGTLVVGTYDPETERVLLSTSTGEGFDTVDITDVLTYPAPIVHVAESPNRRYRAVATYVEPLTIDGGQIDVLSGGGFTGNAVNDLAVDDSGGVWIAHADGIDRFADGEWWSSYGGDQVPIDAAYGVSVAPNGGVWVAGYGAFRFDGESWTVYTTEDGVVASPLMSVEAAGDGSVWFVSLRSGLARWVPSR